jgi:hypothetical protein
MGEEFHHWLSHLRQPEYAHVLLNPLPVYGTALGALALLIALLVRSRGAQGVSLFLIALACLSAWPVAEYGEAGYERVLSMSNSDAQEWLKVHAHRAGNLVFIFYVTAAASAFTLIAVWRRSAKSTALGIVTLLFAIASQLTADFIAAAGGQIRHGEFRDGPPPANIRIHDDAKK